ncbi:hypothetical protein BD769DRAFT_1385756 [Suillus cothurnatus]|nr:hypothetical protein BD769DRAFT_1385756 [Suillus cothurnatus]
MLVVININNLKSLTARDGVKKDNLQQEVGHLKAEVSHLQSGMDSMEQNIRDRLRLVTNRLEAAWPANQDQQCSHISGGAILRPHCQHVLILEDIPAALSLVPSIAGCQTSMIIGNFQNNKMPSKREKNSTLHHLMPFLTLDPEDDEQPNPSVVDGSLCEPTVIPTPCTKANEQENQGILFCDCLV